MVEQLGRWPQALEQAVVTLITKGNGAKPEDLRPISVMSTVYRLWAARRLWDLKVWQEGWAAPGQHGFRPGHGADQVYWSMALKIEESLLTGTPLYG
eukprot:5165337-Karenia_brevis.AAC.1